MRRRSPEVARGFALLEVLATILLVTGAVVGLARLEALALREDAIAHGQAIAAQLAREKLDDLRSFTQLPVGNGRDFGYDEIGGDRGGRKDAGGQLLLPAASLTWSDVDYRLSWTATPQSYCAAGVAASANCAGAARADLLLVQVRVDWTDAAGQTRTMVLESAIAALDPALASAALIRRPSVLPPAVLSN